jgi:EpsI family protein
MLGRALIVCLLLVASTTLIGRTATREAHVARSTLGDLPLEIGAWRGHDAAPFPDDVVATLGVDEYINRRYERARTPVATYIGYYANQRSGDTIHSPQNCLPGAGWYPTSSGRERLQLGPATVTVTRYEIAKGLDRQMVLYWYHGRGRVVAGEYANKAWLMFDAARYGRSNGGLIRLITPVVSTREAALDELSSFAEALLPQLSRYLP